MNRFDRQPRISRCSRLREMKKTMNGEDTLPALKQGIGYELRGQQLYLQLAERICDRRGRRAFHDLARSEIEHQRLLQNQYDSISTGGAYLDIETAQLRDPCGASLSLFPQGDSAPEARVRATSDDLEALAVAMEYEQQIHNSYANARDTMCAAARSTFAHLAAEQALHLAFLRRVYEYLGRKGSWPPGELEVFPA